MIPVLKSSNHDIHGWGHTAVWGGTFDWSQCALLSRIRQMKRSCVFDSNVPPLNNEFESNMPPETWKTSISTLFLVMVHNNTVCTWLRNFVASSALSRLRAFWGGTLGQNLLVGGTQTFLRTGTLLVSRTLFQHHAAKTSRRNMLYYSASRNHYCNKIAKSCLSCPFSFKQGDIAIVVLFTTLE